MTALPWYSNQAETGDDMAQWVQPEFGKGEIDRVGAKLVPWWPDTHAPRPDDLGHCWNVLLNWRTSHAFPLNTFQMGLRQRSKRVEPEAIVAQRLKRVSSILDKLCREPSMKLSQMQDLGGCRAILSNVDAVDRLFELYHGDENLLFESEGGLKYYDYIRKPKSDGYRGIHVVGRYRPRSKIGAPWRGARIEIQLRSQLQHAFATAVETVTTFTRTPLKFGAGPADWRRFFSLMGSALAMREGTPLVEGTPQKESELVRELQEATSALRVRQRLGHWTQALRTLRRSNTQKFKWLLLLLNVSENTIKVTGYLDAREAVRTISEIEQSKRTDLDAVLVYVKSIKDLKAAYPNYYADTSKFIDALTQVLKG